MSKKTAGRLFAAVLGTLMAAASCLAVYAAGSTVTIKECDDLRLTLPDNMTAVTRSAEATDPYFAQHKVSYDGLMQSFREGDTYMQAMDKDNTYTVVLSYLDTGAQDFNELTAEQLDAVSRNFLGGTEADLQYSAATPDQKPEGLTWLYLKMSVTDADKNVSNQYQATTVFSGKNITLTLSRNEGDVEGSDYAVLQRIAQSVQANRAISIAKVLPFLLIAGGIVIAVIAAVVIVKLVKKFRNPDPEKSRKKNDKVIEELAGKYQTRGKPVEAAADDEQQEPEPAQQPDKKPEPETAAETDDAQRRIIRKDFGAEGEAYESKHAAAEEPEAPAAEAPEQPEQPEQPAPQKEAFVDIYAESPEHKKAREEAEAAAAAAAQIPEPEAAPEPAVEEEPASAPEEKKADYRRYLDDDDDDFDDDSDTPVRRYSDEDIERLLADTEDHANFKIALPSDKADSANAEVRDSAKAVLPVIHLQTTAHTASPADRYAGTAYSHTVQILLSKLRSMEVVREEPAVCRIPTAGLSASDEQSDGETAMTDKQRRQTMEEPPDMVSVDGELIVREEWGDSTQEPYAPEIFRTETVFEKEPADDMPLDDVLKKPLVRPQIRPAMRLRLLINDKEIPSAEELKKQTFRDSADFFEEVPDRLSGVVTSGELHEPEDAQEPQKEKKRTGASIAQKLGGGVKSAGVHVGYFVTNIGRAVRRRRRKKAAERRKAAVVTAKRTHNDNRKQ